MKKLLATIISLVFMATVSFAVVGCKGNEEQRPEEAAIEAPAPAEPAEASVPDASPVPDAAPVPGEEAAGEEAAPEAPAE